VFFADTGAISAAIVLEYRKYAPRDSPPTSLGLDENHVATFRDVAARRFGPISTSQRAPKSARPPRRPRRAPMWWMRQRAEA